MQTFLPYEDFALSASCLDRSRLGKQRVETLQILNALSDDSYGWQNHPATKMWRGYELKLVEYGLAVCEEWISRGYKDTCYEKISNLSLNFSNSSKPWWLGDIRIHHSHRSMLYKKNPEFYGSFKSFGHIKNYWWPAS